MRVFLTAKTQRRKVYYEKTNQQNCWVTILLSTAIKRYDFVMLFFRIFEGAELKVFSFFS